MDKHINIATPILNADEILERICNTVHHTATSRYKAFYSSELGGIVTEPAFMMIHMDDHMVHRGHSVFDLSYIEQGYIYQFDRHLERFLSSATSAHIRLAYSKEKIRKIIIETCTAASTRNGEVRFWLSAGRGGFGLSTKECDSSSFYVQVIEREMEIPNFSKYYRIVSSTIPANLESTIRIKSTNYLLNAICLKEAEDVHAQQGVFIDSNGFVVGSSNLDFLIYTGDKRLLIPTFDKFTIGCTAKRIIELVRQFLDNDNPNNREEYEWLYENIQSAEYVPLLRPHDMIDMAKEIFLVGGSEILFPVYQWENERVGEQSVYSKSELFRVLYTLIKQDMIYPGYDSSLLTSINTKMSI
jgi:4-amino-4-deoxychorismate lyase